MCNVEKGGMVYIQFNTLDANGEPIAPDSPFQASHFRIYKDGPTASATGDALTTNFAISMGFGDGNHIIEIDTDDAFFTEGSHYRVCFNTTAPTVDSKVIAGRTIPDHPGFDCVPAGQALFDAAAVWRVLHTSEVWPADSFGERFVDNIDAPISGVAGSVIAHGDGAGAWGAVADTTGLALESSVQSIISTGGPGPWTTADLSAASDWTSKERENIRYRLQIDGTQTAPLVDAGAQLPSTAINMRGTDGANTVVPDNTQGAAVIAHGGPATWTGIGGGGGSGGSCPIEVDIFENPFVVEIAC